MKNEFDIETATPDQLNYMINNVTPEQLMKASNLGGMIAQATFVQDGGVVSPENITDWLELYTQHVWTYVAVYSVANTIAKLKLQLWKKNKITGAIEKVEGHRILELLERPNKDMCRYDLMESLVTFLELAGNAYWEIVYATQTTSVDGKTIRQKKTPDELYNIRPDRLSPVPKKDNKEIDHYVFQTKPNARKKEIPVEEVVPFEYFNPIRDWFGLGAIQPAKEEILQDLNMIKWNKDFFEGGVIPQGVLTTELPINKVDQTDLNEQLKQFLIGKGRKILLLSRGLKFEQVSVNPKDLDFLKGRDDNKHAVLAAEGVPPVMAGIMDNAKYANYILQINSYHTDTILPKLRKIESALRNHFVIRFPDLVPTDEYEYVLLFDTTELLQEDEDRVTDRLDKQFRNGWLSINEARAKLNMEPYPDGVEGGDDFYISTNLTPLKKSLSEEGLERAEDELFTKMAQLENNITDAVSIMKSEIKQELLDESDDPKEIDVEKIQDDANRQIREIKESMAKDIAAMGSSLKKELKDELMPRTAG